MWKNSEYVLLTYQNVNDLEDFEFKLILNYPKALVHEHEHDTIILLALISAFFDLHGFPDFLLPKKPINQGLAVNKCVMIFRELRAGTIRIHEKY